jgi:hypothetical protein
MALRPTPTSIPMEMWGTVLEIVRTKQLPENKNEALRACEDTEAYCRGMVYPDPGITLPGGNAAEAGVKAPKPCSAKEAKKHLEALASGKADAGEMKAGGLWLGLMLVIIKAVLDALRK